MITPSDRERYSKIRSKATVLEWDFEAADGVKIAEKAASLAKLLGEFEVDFVVGGAETTSLLEVSECPVKIEKDNLFPLAQLLLVGPRPQLIVVKNFLN